ncbi:MAG: hypothetical protein CK425_12270 [Parachlamydia sp.]|nr:MAG: hypothetical protein CK425_12270 [Parachlamydia sp.]
MRLLLILGLSCSLVVGSWWFWNHNEDVRALINQYIENGEILTLEARFTPQQIMELHQDELLGKDQRAYKEPLLKFHPHLFLEVKYTQPDKKSREGVVLWSLVEGEMVLNTQTWEKTHGFEDSINAGASREDFKIMNALAQNRGIMSREKLRQVLNLEEALIEPWIDSTRQKHLVIQRGNDLQLHFQNPKILVVPQTKIFQKLVTKPYDHTQRVSRKYSQRQIERIAYAAFGQDFAIRTAKEVYLPVYLIEVANPDGSVMTSYWNAVTGQQLISPYLAGAA